MSLVRSISVEDDENRTSRSQNLEPIVIKFPIKTEHEYTSVPKIDQREISNTIRKVGAMQRSIPKQFILKSFVLLLVGLLLFYLLLIAVAVMLFNIVLVLVSLILISNYLKWAFLSLRQLRREVNLRKIKKFL